VDRYREVEKDKRVRRRKEGLRINRFHFKAWRGCGVGVKSGES
jgi:hypothetical protein